MHTDLSFEQAPPISVPLRFFLTAPWFGVAAGLLLLALGADALSVRWAPATLATTHLLTLGFMLQAMLGALLQFIPVAAGGNVWRPRWVAGLVHPTVAVATLLLAAGFLAPNPTLLEAAFSLIAMALALFVPVVGVALWRVTANPTVVALRLALGGLVVTVLLGGDLAAVLGGHSSAPAIPLTNVHAAWGLGGWALTLLLGVSYFVVPMFQMTPPYPRRLAGLLPVCLVAALVLWSLTLAEPEAGWPHAGLAALLGGGALYALVTLGLQRRRRRKLNDPTLLFFRAAMVCTLLAAISGLAALAIPALADAPQLPLWLGVLLLPGLFMSTINGMLYKIVPFLAWLHLQRADATGRTRPNMRSFIPDAAMRGQQRLHFLALLLLLASILWPPLTRPAGLALAISCAWLEWNLAGAVRIYRRLAFELRQGVAA